MQIPQIGPEAVLGIEINAYAAELARVTSTGLGNTGGTSAELCGPRMLRK
jgi:hypothetical protein